MICVVLNNMLSTVNVFHVTQSSFLKNHPFSSVVFSSSIRYKIFLEGDFYDVLTAQGSSFCNSARLSFQAFALRDIKCQPKKVVA